MNQQQGNAIIFLRWTRVASSGGSGPCVGSISPLIHGNLYLFVYNLCMCVCVALQCYSSSVVFVVHMEKSLNIANRSRRATTATTQAKKKNNKHSSNRAEGRQKPAKNIVWPKRQRKQFTESKSHSVCQSSVYTADRLGRCRVAVVEQRHISVRLILVLYVQFFFW